jgi:hypothetical protein
MAPKTKTAKGRNDSTSGTAVPKSAQRVAPLAKPPPPNSDSVKSSSSNTFTEAETTTKERRQAKGKMREKDEVPFPGSTLVESGTLVTTEDRTAPPNGAASSLGPDTKLASSPSFHRSVEGSVHSGTSSTRSKAKRGQKKHSSRGARSGEGEINDKSTTAKVQTTPMTTPFAVSSSANPTTPIPTPSKTATQSELTSSQSNSEAHTTATLSVPPKRPPTVDTGPQPAKGRATNPKINEICQLWIRKRCIYGGHCKFLHERPPLPTNNAAPAEAIDIIAPVKDTKPHMEVESTAATHPDGRGSKRPKVCFKFLQGRCIDEKRCQYAHVSKGASPSFDVIDVAESAPRPPPKEPSVSGQEEDTSQVSDSSHLRWETNVHKVGEDRTICRFFQQHGWCLYGSKCVHKHVLPDGQVRLSRFLI